MVRGKIGKRGKYMIEGSSKVSVSKDVVSCEMDQDAVLLNLVDGKYHELNDVAASIWAHVQESRTVDEILSFLLKEYQVDEEQCSRDLTELLDSLSAKGLIAIQGGEPI